MFIYVFFFIFWFPNFCYITIFALCKRILKHVICSKIKKNIIKKKKKKKKKISIMNKITCTLETIVFTVFC